MAEVRQLTPEEMQSFREAVAEGNFEQVEISQVTAEMIVYTMDLMLEEIEKTDTAYRECATYLKVAIDQLDEVQKVIKELLEEAQLADVTEPGGDMKIPSEIFDDLSKLFPESEDDVEEVEPPIK